MRRDIGTGAVKLKLDALPIGCSTSALPTIEYQLVCAHRVQEA